MRRPVLTLLLLSALTFFLGLGRPAITDSDEAFYAEASREMVESGDWLTPRFNYEERFQKPVLYYWLTSATYMVAGISEWTARLWSALSGLGLVVLTFAIARSATRRIDTAWLAGAIVATCFGCFYEARLALPDLPLTFCITLTIWAALRAADTSSRDTAARARRWWALAGLAAGLGFLMKGPVALAIPGIVLLPVWWRERRTISVPPSGLVIAASVFAIVGLPWYVAMWAEHGVRYLNSFFIGDNLERFATARYNEPRPLWFYVPIVLGGLMPWSVFFVAFSAAGVPRLLRRQLGVTGTDWRLLLWAAMPLLFYTVSIGKQPRYVLPVLAPIAILLARGLMHRIDSASAGLEPTALRLSTWMTALMLALVAVLFGRAREVFINVNPLASWIAVASTGVAAAAIAWVALVRCWRRLPPVMAAASAAVLLSVQFGALAGRRPEAVEQMAHLVTAHQYAGHEVGQYEVFVRNLVFYTRSPQQDLLEQTVVPFVRSSEPVLLVVRETDAAWLEMASGRMLREVGRVRYFNAANLRLRTFVRPDPAREVETIVLLSSR